MYIVINLDSGVVRVYNDLVIEEYKDVWDDFTVIFVELDDEGNFIISEVVDDGSLDEIDPE